MRAAQRWVFWCGVVAFVASAVFMGGWIGDTLWRAGVAAMLVVLAMRAVLPEVRADELKKGTGG